MRILMTGGAGYIGSHATRLFRKRAHEVWVLDNLSRGHRQAIPAECLIEGELADVELLRDVFRRHRIEAIVHFAGVINVRESVADPGLYYTNNIIGTLKLFEAARHEGVKRVVFSSTAAVYGAPERMPIQESDQRRPINPYGRCKQIIEDALADYAAAYGIGYVALRYFNAAGASPDGGIGEAHDPETHLIPIVLQAALGRRTHVDVFGVDYPTSDGTCVRDYIHVDDLSEAHLLALDHITSGSGDAFNLGIGHGYSVAQVIQTCQEVTRREIKVRHTAARLGNPAFLVASPAKAMRVLGWQPRYTELRSIVETAWMWHQSNPDGFGESAARSSR